MINDTGVYGEMILESAFKEQLARYIERNYNEYSAIINKDMLCETHTLYADIPKQKELTRDQSMDLRHLLDEAGDSFHEKLFELIDKSGMSDVEVYKRAGIDRRLFSKIRSNPAYHPRKEHSACTCICIKVGYKSNKRSFSQGGICTFSI